jgi:hypothetical protein
VYHFGGQLGAGGLFVELLQKRCCCLHCCVETLHTEVVSTVADGDIEALAYLLDVFVKLASEVGKAFDIAGLKDEVLAGCAVVQAVYIPC